MVFRRHLIDLLSRELRSVSSLARELGGTRATMEEDLRHAIRARPVVIASANGHRYRNGGSIDLRRDGLQMMTEGRDVLDALIAGVNIVELDPEDTSVGYGGLPNGDGVVQLDASCMHGPTKRAGAVACARRRAHAVARGAKGAGDDGSPPARRA
jgi:hypothetical protein